jgi:membrane-bound inhibitor of C-type lysozyme
MRPASALIACSFALLAGCGLWPFGETNSERSRAPADATAYQCEGGKRFYLRYLNNAQSAWVIFPEREFRLDKAPSASGTRYVQGPAVLEVTGDTLNLVDGPGIRYTNCKTTGDR